MLETKYDPEAKAAYVKLSDKKTVRTVSPYHGKVNFDFDKNDELVGIEILNVKLKREGSHDNR